MEAKREILDIRNAEGPENVWDMMHERTSLLSSLKATPSERGAVGEVPICFFEPGISNTLAEMLGEVLSKFCLLLCIAWSVAKGMTRIVYMSVMMTALLPTTNPGLLNMLGCALQFKDICDWTWGWQKKMKWFFLSNVDQHRPPLVGTKDLKHIYSKIFRTYAKNSSSPKPT